jgi:chromate transporter
MMQTSESFSDSGAGPARLSPPHIFSIFLRLGCTCFGGPIAHLGYFRDELVRRRAWVSEEGFADIVALCQFMPGPSSSQVGIALGLRRGGLAGALAAWLGFTLPSALVLMVFGIVVRRYGHAFGLGWLQGLKLVALAVVAQALWAMARNLCPDWPRAGIAVVSGALMLALQTPLAQIAVLLFGAASGWALRSRLPVRAAPDDGPHAGGALHAGSALIAFAAALVLLPVLAAASGAYWLRLFSDFFRVGSLVFGGGHVVLPLLEAVVVPSGWVSQDAFFAGYGAAQAVPGPLFTFAAFLGSASSRHPTGIAGAAIATVAIFLPSFLLVIGVTPVWNRVRARRSMRVALMGVNAAVVGLLAAAFWQPLWLGTVHRGSDLAFAALALLLLTVGRVPPWAVVLVAGVAGYLLL